MPEETTELPAATLPNQPPMGDPVRRVFISHASEDRAWAETVCRALEEAGIPCWIAPRDVPAGANYGQAIIAALDDCRAVVLIFSAYASASDMVAREIKRAAARGLPLVPVKVQEGTTPRGQLEFFLSTAQWIDGTRAPRRDRLAALVEAVRRVGGVAGSASGRAAATPDHVGPYVLLSRIGEGGMGEVWLAEQREPIRRRVALKIIKPGMDSRAVIARFEQERQALAVMDHACIAKVFDAGATAEGRPYFAMEYVKGEPITAYCDRHRLSITDRLRLFARVCDAVHHAHMKGLIHRDLKPGNILVCAPDAADQGATGVGGGGGAARDAAGSGEPRPVVIDFGVAKAVAARLTEKTIFTEHGQLIGTPEYMSPEQAEMAETDIDTRTDIYALGVVLYELLTGALPFEPASLRSAGYAAIQRMIREVDPPRPSTRLSTMKGEEGDQAAGARRARLDELAGLLRRELEWIPLKALRKDRAERYRSAAELADDVDNYLASRPLIAGPESAGYRVRKFVRRNKGGVAAGMGLVAMLVLGLGGTLWQADQARREAERANAEAARADERAVEATRAAAAEAEARLVADAKTAEAEAERAAAVKAKETIEWNSYVANIEMAGATLEMRLLDRVHQRLSACPARLRGWEWGWLNAEMDDSLFLLKGPTSEVRHASFSPDGTRIVTASRDKTARVWDVKKGTEIIVLNGHGLPLGSAVFSPDGTRVHTAATRELAAGIWDAVTGERFGTVKGYTGQVESALLSRDGSRIVTLLWDNTARVWDAATGTMLADLNRPGTYCVAINDNGTRIVTGSGDGASVWDVATGACILEFHGHTGRVIAAAISRDGSLIVTGSEDGTARVWDTAAGTSLTELRGHAGAVSAVAVRPDGLQIATGSSDATVRLWDPATGVPQRDFVGHVQRVRSIEFSADGARIVTASDDCTARVWDTAVRADRAQFVPASSCWSLAFDRIEAELPNGREEPGRTDLLSPDASRIVRLARGKAPVVYESATGKRLAELKENADRVALARFNHDGSRVVTASGSSAQVWDAATGIALFALEGHKSRLRTAGFNATGTRIVTGDSAGCVRLWDETSGAMLTELMGVHGLISSSDGARLAAVSALGSVRVLDAATGVCLVEFRHHGSRRNEFLATAAFSPDGTRLVTATVFGTVRVWDAATGSSLTELTGHTNRVCSAAFSPDGTRLATGSFDNTARVWDAATGDGLAELQGHTGRVMSVAFSADGTRIATASTDGTARVWDAASACTLVELRGHRGAVISVAFNQDGTWIATNTDEGESRIWDSVPNRVRYAERRENAKGRDGGAIVKAWLAAVKAGTEKDFKLPPLD